MDMDIITQICNLFSQCSHEDQLLLLEKLPMFLCRDFISFLPAEIVSIVVAYLHPRDVLNSCMLVSRDWYRVLTSCESYWKRQYTKLHKTRGDGSSKVLTVATLRFESKLRSLKLNLKTSLDGIPIGASKHWLYSNAYGELVISNKSDTDNTLVTFKVNYSSRVIVWSLSVGCGGLFYDNMGLWVYVPYPDLRADGGTPLLPLMWQDEIRSPAHFHFGGCEDCLLVVEAKKSLTDASNWSLEVIKLLDGSETAQRAKITFTFLPDSKSQSSPFFTIRSLKMFSNTKPVSNTPPNGMYCKEHLIFIQIGPGVLVYTLIDNSGFHLSGPIHTLCPLNRSFVDVGRVNPSLFTTSANRSLVAVLPDQKNFTVWDLKENIEYSSSVSASRNVLSVFVLSVGKLYSMIGFELANSSFEIRIVSTTSGREIFKASTELDFELSFKTRVNCVHSNSELSLDDLYLRSPFELCTVQYESIIPSRKLPSIVVVLS